MGLPFDLWPKMTTNIVLTQTHPCSLWRESTTIYNKLISLDTEPVPIKKTQNQSFTNNEQVSFHHQLCRGQRQEGAPISAVVVRFEERKERYKWESNSVKGERKPNIK